MSKTIATLTVALALAAIWSAGMVTAQTPADGPRKAPGEPVVVLDTHSVWRTFQTLKPPVLALDSGLTPVLAPKDWMNRDTPEPPEGWTQVNFDDSTWLRGSSRSHAQTPYLSRLCLRARFQVADPSQVSGLKLKLSYYGGAIVYLNGREVKRANLTGQGAATIGEGYPVEAFVAEDGKIVPSGWIRERYKAAMAARERTLKDVDLPSASLVQGVNVVAVELIRSPYHKVVDEKKEAMADPKARDSKGSPYDLSWNTCEMRGIQLTAAEASGLTPNAVRPKGEVQIWNSDVLLRDYESDLGDRCEPLRPVAIKGARNGWFSGKVVLGSDQSIEGLAVTCSDLKQGGETIPASAVRVRYGWSWGGDSGAAYSEALPASRSPLDALLEKPLDAFPSTGAGAVVPVWFTVRVPKAAKAGTYAGTATVTTKGGFKRDVALTLDVADWTLPDQQDYRTWVELIQSPDTLAEEYKVPLWSDAHWKLMAQSMRYIGESSSRVAYVPLIAQTNFGNAESMVRWIKKDDGTCDYDFTIVDKYLDMVAKEMGTPDMVVFTAWEIYLKPPENEVKVAAGDSDYVKMEKSWAAARWDLRDKGPAVTALDPSTGKTELVRLPRYEDASAKALWAPLFKQLRQRLAARGWEKAMVIGMASDVSPSKAEMTVLQEVSGGLPWIMHTHGGNRVGQKIQGQGEVCYVAYVWNVAYAPDPSEGRLYGWQRNELETQFLRFGGLNNMSPSALAHFLELNITGRQRGLGRIGADFWAPFKNNKGRREGYAWSRYPQSLWHSLNLSSHMLVPGPDGPVASTRYEYLRQGLQECEARIALERILTDEALKAKLGTDLAKRCQDVLDERLRETWRAGSEMNITGREYATGKLGGDSYGGYAGHCWYVGSGWQERSQKFLNLVAEATAKAGTK
jgi:hypothetical protein